MIKPTVGRIVHFREYPGQFEQAPLAAIIVSVHHDTMINLKVFGQNGYDTFRPSIFLWDGEGDEPTQPYAHWMPYQIGQAKANGDIK